MTRFKAPNAIESNATKFNQARAEHIAAISFRAGDHRPLHGLEAQLLDALICAEKGHDAALSEWSRKRKNYLQDLKIIAIHQEFYSHFKPAFKFWQEMDATAKDVLLRYTQNQLEMIDDSSRVPLKRLRKRCDDTLDAIERAAGEKIAPHKGRTSGISQSVGDADKPLKPLFVFISALESFWKKNVKGHGFTQQFDGDAPLSASAKMVVEATTHLNVRYSPANIRSIMRMLCAKPPKDFPEGEFDFVFPRIEY